MRKSNKADAKSPITLKINGTPIIEALAHRSQFTQLITFLNQSPDGEVYDTAAIAAELGTTRETVVALKNRYGKKLQVYSTRIGCYTYYARPDNLKLFVAAVTTQLDGGR